MKKKNISTVEAAVQSSDPAVIISYLEEMMEHETARIRDEGIRQLRELEDKLERDLDLFRKEEKQKAEKNLTDEGERLSRTSGLEGRRIVSRLIEELFEEVINEAAERAGGDEATFQRISSVIQKIAVEGKKISVSIAPGDDPLKEAIKGLGLKGITIIEDSSIHNGGAIIGSDDDSLLNLTIERLLFRKKESMRLEMMTILREEGLLAKLEEMYGSW